MMDATLERLILTRGADFPPVAAALEALPADHPLRVQAAADRAAVQARGAAIAALRSAAADAKARAGTGSTPARLDDLEARLAALEAGA